MTVIIHTPPPSKVVITKEDNNVIVNESKTVVNVNNTTPAKVVIDKKATNVVISDTPPKHSHSIEDVVGLSDILSDLQNSEEYDVYAKQTDFVGESTIYRGEAVPGSLTTAPVWRIRKLLLSVDGDVMEVWADGDANFDNIWDDRATLIYS
jgi:hypothetical protein